MTVSSKWPQGHGTEVGVTVGEWAVSTGESPTGNTPAFAVSLPEQIKKNT